MNEDPAAEKFETYNTLMELIRQVPGLEEETEGGRYELGNEYPCTECTKDMPWSSFVDSKCACDLPRGCCTRWECELERITRSQCAWCGAKGTLRFEGETEQFMFNYQEGPLPAFFGD